MTFIAISGIIMILLLLGLLFFIPTKSKRDKKRKKQQEEATPLEEELRAKIARLAISSCRLSCRPAFSR
jgi:hypothetical protein